MAQKSKHTPGPWQVSDKTDALTIDSRKTGCRIAQCSKNGKFSAQQAANAHLIAAAPELLFALEQVDGFFTALGKYTRDYPGSVHTHKLVRAALKAAIAEVAA